MQLPARKDFRLSRRQRLVTLHPDGIPHGPHPGRTEQSLGQSATNELAVMLDTFRPLRVSSAALEIEDRDYFRSWVEGGRA